ncbi:MAG: putative membrane protein, partial [Flammeovirgaceae bacterium]
KGGSILLFIGVVGAWISVYTGNLADGIVSRNLCDPTVLKDHEHSSLIMAWLFTIAVLLEAAYSFLRRGWFNHLVVALMIAGSGFLVYTGHLGATLVYQQAAGVYVPSDDCEEFE